MCVGVYVRAYDRGVRLPAHQRTAPGEAAAHTFQQHQVAFLDAAVLDRLEQGERDRRGGGVRVPVHGRHHPLGRQVEAFAGCLDDPHVRLVGHQPIDIVGA